LRSFAFHLLSHPRSIRPTGERVLPIAHSNSSFATRTQPDRNFVGSASRSVARVSDWSPWCTSSERNIIWIMPWLGRSRFAEHLVNRVGHAEGTTDLVVFG